MLGTLKARRVVAPLSSAFGPEPVPEWLHTGRTGVGDQRRLRTAARSSGPVRDRLPDLEHVLLIGPHAGTFKGDG